MKIIKPYAEILQATPDLENLIELAGRVCYKSEDRICEGSAATLISRLMESKHESVLEHGAITVRFVCDRGVSHELVRHRLASFSQESTRYCNYGKAGEVTFIDIFGGFPDVSQECVDLWRLALIDAERYYLSMLKNGSTPQEARSVLPNSLKTEVVMTANPREWLHIFRLRCARTAHPQMREVMIPLQTEFQKRWPVIFGHTV